MQILGKREVKLTPIFFRPSNWKKRVDIHSDEEDSRKNKYLLACLDVISDILSFEMPIWNKIAESIHREFREDGLQIKIRESSGVT